MKFNNTSDSKHLISFKLCTVKHLVKTSNNNDNDNKWQNYTVYCGDRRRVPIVKDSSVLVEQRLMNVSQWLR